MRQIADTRPAGGPFEVLPASGCYLALRGSWPDGDPMPGEPWQVLDVELRVVAAGLHPAEARGLVEQLIAVAAGFEGRAVA